MFDDLHDPDPPTADSTHFADVSERAHSMRTRRYTIFGAASLAGVVAVGALAFAATGGGGDDDLVVSPGGSGGDPGVPLATVDSTTTTALPVATTVPPPTTIRVTTSIAPPPTTTSTTKPEPPPTEAPTPTTEPPTPSTTAAPATVPPATTTTEVPAVIPIAGPFVAIDGDGDAVLLADTAATPVVLFDGADPDDAGQDDVLSADAAAVTRDGSTAWIGGCCEPIAGTILQARPPTPATEADMAYFGYNPAVDPGGTHIATADISGTVAVYAIGGDSAAVRSPEPATPFTITDVTWTSPNTVIALGQEGSLWIVRAFGFDGASLAPLTEAPVDGSDTSGRYEFGGITASGGALVHRTGSATFHVVPLGDGEQPATSELPFPSLSMWSTPEAPPMYVDDQRVLHVGDQIVPGEFIWARR